MAGIWIFGEDYQQSLELLNIGRSLAQELDTHVVSFALNRIMAQDYLDHGSDEVMLLPALPNNQPFEAYV
ncbi:MAG TPA: electron transfer flavoprotein subunit alpha/FixB family protein, partial [Syntrophomonas sp.]|nr:electron transfer flavoprotein subunit alpha/FixB family protein [Syntrophomonas sp.]